MSLPPHIRSRLGRMPAPARGYLAAATALALLLLAAHFALQAHMEQRLHRSIQDLLTRMGGSIGEVHYRLLRGALTVSDVHVKRGDLELRVPVAYLHAPSLGAATPHPRFSLIRIEGMTVSLPQRQLWRLLAGETPWPPQLRATVGYAQNILLRQARLRLVAASKPWTVSNINGRISGTAFAIEGHSGMGDVHLQGEKFGNSIIGVYRWRRLPVSAWLPPASASPTIPSQGNVHWRLVTEKQSLDLDAGIDLESRPQAGKVHVHGHLERGVVQLKIACSHVGLAGLSALLPVIEGRKVAAGDFNGNVDLKRKAQSGWRAHIRGDLGQLTLGAADLPEWNMQHVSVSGMDLDFSNRKLHAGHLGIETGELGLLLGKESPSPTWKLNVEELEFAAVRVSLRRSGHKGWEFDLPPLHGVGRWHADAGYVLDAVAKEKEPWKFRIESDPRRGIVTRITAGPVAAVRLRPFLPPLALPGATGTPQLSGSAVLNLVAASGKDGIHLRGDAVLDDFKLAQGGDSFHARRMQIRIEDVDTRGRRILGPLRIHGWHYQAALHPIPRAIPVQAQPAEPPGHSLPWQVAGITASDGVLSVGSSEAKWAHKVSIRVGALKAGRMAPMELEGAFGGGYLWIHGAVDPFSSIPRVRMQARLRHALPFFLNPWLAVSGAPRLLRGRLDADLSLKPGRKPSTYAGRLRFTIREPLLESGTFPRDPFIPLLGSDLRTLARKLSHRRRVALSVPFKGDWRRQPFSLRVLGMATLRALKARNVRRKKRPAASIPSAAAVAHVRLQSGRAFSHNEHVRLWGIVKLLRRHRHWIVELVPKLGHRPLDAEWIARVRRTQDMISRYLRKRGIYKRRIFPVWPDKTAQKSDIVGIDILVRAP